MIIHLAATNDTNGNPRRLYVKLDRRGFIAGAWDEGYLGSGAIPSQYRREVVGPRLEITPGEYGELKRLYCK